MRANKDWDEVEASDDRSRLSSFIISFTFITYSCSMQLLYMLITNIPIHRNCTEHMLQRSPTNRKTSTDMQQATIHFLLRTKNFRVAGDRTAVGRQQKGRGDTVTNGQSGVTAETGTTEKQSSEKRKQAEATKPVCSNEKSNKENGLLTFPSRAFVITGK
ncbi:unnamed protein product [Sphagnum balticum]